MEAILQTIQEETKVEWKKIFDGFVVSGTFEQIKKVHEFLNDHLQKKKQHKESTQKYSSRPMVRDTSTIRPSMFGSQPSTGPTSFRTPTDSTTTIYDAEVRKYNKPLTLENSQVKGNKSCGNFSQTESNFQEKFAISVPQKTNEVGQPVITRDTSRLLPAKVTHISSTNNNGKNQDQLVTEPQGDGKNRPTAVTPSVKNQMALFEDNKEKGSKARHLKTEVVVDALPISRVFEIRNTSTTDGKTQVQEESKPHGDFKDRQLAVHATNGKTNRGSEPKLQRLASGIPKGNDSCKDAPSKSTLANENCTAEKSSPILTALDEAFPQENEVCSHNETPKSAEVIKRSESSEEEGKYTMAGNYYNYITSTGITVMLLKGDITSQDVDVLLSPANPTLSHKEGLSKLICEKGGEDIEDECLSITQTKGHLEYGTTCFTSSGKLPCRVVLHSVLPPWINENKDKNACKLQIHRCLKNGLTLASGHRHRSVAFPPLGQDWNCIPLDVSVEVITRVIAVFSKNVGPMHSGINDFRIVCEDDATIDAFVKELTSFSFRDEKPVFVSTMSKRQLNDADQIVKCQRADRCRKGCDQDVDSSTKKERSLEQMQMANSLPGSYSPLDKGNAEIHAGSPKIESASSSQLKSDSPESCEDRQSKSTLFNGNCTAQESSSILTALNEARPQENHVSPCNESPKSAEDIMSSGSLSKAKGKCTTEEISLNYITSTGITVMLLKGDITSQDVDVLLNPANPTLSHKEGLSKLIREKGGEDIEDECLSITPTQGPLEYGTTFFTSGGKLPCRSVLHAVLPPWINENEDMKACKLQIHRCLTDGLTLASGYRYTSIAFSQLAQDWNCIPPEVSVEVITRVIAVFSKSVGPMHTGINDFRIVCEDDATIDAFVKEFTSFSLRDEKPFFVSAMSKNTLNDGDQIVKYQSAKRHRKGYDQDVHSSIEKERYVEQMQKGNSSPKSDSLLDKESGEIPAGSPKIESASSSQLKSDSPESPAILHGISDANDDSLKNAKQCHQSAVTFIPGSCIERSDILETKALELLEVKETTVTGLEEETSKRLTSQDDTKRELVKEFNLNVNNVDLKVRVMEPSELTEGTSALKNSKVITEIQQAEHSLSPAHNEQNEDILGSAAHYSQGSVEDTTSLHPLPAGQETSVVISSDSSSLIMDGGLFVASPTVEALLNADLSLGLQGLRIEHDRRTKNNNKETHDKGQESFLSLQQKKVRSDINSPIAFCNLMSTDESNSNQKTEKHAEKDINENVESQMAPVTADTDNIKEPNQKFESEETKDTKDEFESAVLVENYHDGNSKVSTERQITFLCALCQDTVDHPELTDPTVCAEHKFCDDCILKAFTFSDNCPACGDAYGLIISQRGNNVEHNLTATKVLHSPVPRRSPSIGQEGDEHHWKADPDLLQANQPPGQMMWKKYGDSLPGFEGYGTIVVTYNFYDGIQSAEHPSPGESYTGMSCMAYFPDTQEGRHVLKLLHKAFDARLVFTVSKSASDGTGHVVINGIELKTTAKGDARNGYPDGGYLSRVKVQLAAKGIQ